MDGRVSAPGRAREQLRETRDRFLASDPGWVRARSGLRAAVAVGTTLIIELGAARLTGRPAVLPVLMGAVIALITSTGIRETRRSAVRKVTGLALVMAAGGVSLGVLTSQVHLLGLVAFVVVSFVAVWVRRFGPRWFSLGFAAWQGFFFALFLRPPVSELPYLLLSVTLSAAWVGLLLSTVLFDNPQRKLRRVVAALRARARAGIATAIDVLDDPGELRKVRRLRRQLTSLREIALLVDGLLADPRALPAGVGPGRMRRWTVDVEIGMDELGAAVLDVADLRGDLPEQAVVLVRRLLTELSWGEPSAGRQAAARVLRTGAEVPALRRTSTAATFLLDTVARWDSGELSSAAAADASPDPLDADDFEPAVTLVQGNLPGTAVLAQQALERRLGAMPERSRRFGRHPLSLSNRQAIQAAVAAGLAIVAGEAISSRRFYWAVIAAFLTFAGTATSGESVKKASGRITGTLIGLGVAVLGAEVTRGHPPLAIALILVSIFLAFMLQPVSTTGMIVFITVMLGQLYTLLGTYSDEVLVLRVAETAAGAGIGIGVSLLVLPSHSRATLREARRAFCQQLAELLDGCAQALAGQDPRRNLLASTVAVDAAARQLVRTRQALTRGRLFGADRMAVRHRVSILGACAAAARALSVEVDPVRPQPQLAAAVGLLAAHARRLAAAGGLAISGVDRSDPISTTASVRTLCEQTEKADGATPSSRAVRRLADSMGLLDIRLDDPD